MKEKSSIRKLLESLIFINVILLGVVFLASRQMVFSGALEGYDAFNIIVSYEEEQSFKLLRANNESKQDVLYALHTTYSDAVIVFLHEEEELLRIFSSDIPETDFFTFRLENANRKEIQIVMLQEEQEMMRTTFLYLEDYTDTIGLAYQYSLMQDILLEDVKTTKNLRDYDVLATMLAISLGAVLIVGVLYLLLKSQTVQQDSNELHSKPEEKTGKEARVLKSLFKRIFVHLLIGFFLTILTIYILVALFSEDSFYEDPYDFEQGSVLFASEEDEMFGFTMHIGVRKYFFRDGEWGTWVVIYSVRMTQELEDVYILSMDCNDRYFGRVFSDMGAAFNGSPSGHYGDFEMDNAQLCGINTEFRLVIRDPNTALIVYESALYPLYLDAFEVMETFEIEDTNDVPYFTLYVFLFHSIVSATFIRKFYKKIEPKLNQAFKKPFRNKQF